MLVVDLCAGADLTGALVRLKVPSGVSRTATNNNFVAGDYVATGSTGGLTGDGTTKYIDTLINPSSLGYSVSSFGIWTYRMTAIVGTGTSRASMGSTAAAGADSTIVGWLNGGAEENLGIAADISGGPTQYSGRTGTSFHGFVGGCTNGSRVQTLYRNGATSGAANTATGAFANRNLYRHAANLNGTAGTFNVRREGSSYITSGLSAAEAVTFNTIVQAFETALGRNV